LTGLLLDALVAGSGRIVNVSSLAHSQGRINFDDINAESGYEPFARYGMSKMANLLFTLELARRFDAKGIPCGAVASHPGATATELGRHTPPVLQTLTSAVRFMFNTPDEGALPTLLAATHTPLRQGSYYGPQGLMELASGAREVQPHIRARDPDVAARLWDLSEELTGVKFNVLGE
jgi:NAD(P)-dependent dehydrogenase (short-subunit alcohol dehydrogenase family)